MLLPCDEYDGWFEYLKWKNKETKKAAGKSKTGGKVITI
jgi:hypothetical protein